MISEKYIAYQAKVDEQTKQKLDEQEKSKKENENFYKTKSIIIEELNDRSPDRSFISEEIYIFIRKEEYIYTIREDDNDEMWIYKDGIYIPEAKTYIKEWCRKLLGRGYSAQMANSVINKIEVETYTEKEDFFKVNDLNRIAVLNGIVDIRTKTLYDFDPKEIFFNKINAEFDEDATCNAIDEHLHEVLKSKEDVPVIYELFGFCLYRDYKIEKSFMLTGEGRNGKSKTVELLKLFLNPANCCNINLSQIEKSEFAMINFHNKLANICSDLSKTSMDKSGNFKQLTGHDMISANRKMRSYIHFVNHAKLVFCTNSLPSTMDSSAAFWNRWILLEFPYAFLPQNEINAIPEDEREFIKLQDPDKINKLTDPDQMSGLLNKSIDALNTLLKNREFSYQPTVSQLQSNWERMQDSCSAFIMDNIVQDFESEISSFNMKKSYIEYCQTHKIKKSTDRDFNKKLRDVFSTQLVQKSTDFKPAKGREYVWEMIKFKEK